MEAPEQCVKSVQSLNSKDNRTMEIPEQRRSDVFIVIFEQVLHIVLVFASLLWSIKCQLGINWLYFS